MKFDNGDHQIISLAFEGAVERRVRGLSEGRMDVEVLLQTLKAFEDGKLAVTVLAPGIWDFIEVKGASVFTQKRRNKRLFSMVMAGTKSRSRHIGDELTDEDKVNIAVADKSLGAINVLADGEDRAFTDRIRVAVEDRDKKLAEGSVKS